MPRAEHKTRKGGRWANTLTEAQRRRCLAAMGYNPDQPFPRDGGKGWSVVLDRSVGVPWRIVLRYRDGYGRIVRDITIDAQP